MIDLYDKEKIGKRNIVGNGLYKSGHDLYKSGHEWYVVSYGAHPCAYIKSDIPEKLADNIEVHGGITYIGRAFPEFEAGGQFIGWDYNHAGDYNATYPYCQDGTKKWTIDEICEDIKSVIVQLEEMGW